MKTEKEPKTWKPTDEMIRAAENCFAAMAFTETIKPIVRGYQRRILDDMQAPLRAEWRERFKDHAPIADPENTYLMEDSDFQIYLSRCREEQEKAGLHTDSPEYCPLLVAEELQRQAEHAFIDIMEPLVGVTFDRLMGTPHCIENLKKYLDLTLKMMVRFCHTGPEVMKRFAV